MSKIPVALQLYSVREDCAKDFPGVLKAVAEMGYAGVEFAGYYGLDAPTLKKLLDDLNLKVCGAHVGIDQLTGDKLEETARFHEIIGNRYLIVPWIGEERHNSRQAWINTANELNQIGERLKPLGMRTGYHNHDFEFQSFDGETGWDIFFGHTNQDVIMQLDTGNAMHGGATSTPILRKHPGRAITVHLKEYSKTNPNALLGEGDVPWDEVFQACETLGGTEWYIVEVEQYPYPPLECAKRSLEALKRMGKA